MQHYYAKKKKKKKKKNKKPTKTKKNEKKEKIKKKKKKKKNKTKQKISTSSRKREYSSFLPLEELHLRDRCHFQANLPALKTSVYLPRFLVCLSTRSAVAIPLSHLLSSLSLSLSLPPLLIRFSRVDRNSLVRVNKLSREH